MLLMGLCPVHDRKEIAFLLVKVIEMRLVFPDEIEKVEKASGDHHFWVHHMGTGDWLVM